MATKEEIDEQALQEAYASFGDELIRTKSPQGVFRVAFLAGRESMTAKDAGVTISIDYIKELILRYWRFDANQQPTSSYHEREALLEKIDKFRQAIGGSK